MAAVLLFVKAPRLGRVKTRLAAEVGEHRALQVYRWMGRRVVDVLAPTYPLTVWFAPPGAEPEVRSWLGDHEFRPQPPGDLGARLAYAYRWHTRRGDRPVVAVGADVPGLGRESVAAACRLLRQVDVVLGPARDGGYYLVGLNQPHDAVFRNIPWGSARVMEVTLAACAAADLSVGQLEVLRDVDNAADLAALGTYVP